MADTDELIAFILKQYDEEEQWALAASKPYRHAIGNPEVPPGGVHWTWVVGENWQPVTPNPVEDELVSLDDRGVSRWDCNLATVEEWQAERWMMPNTYANSITEMDSAAAGHIVRHDPASVLADIAAKRRILTEIVDDANGLDDSLDLERRVGERDLATEPRLGDLLLKILAEPFASRDGYKETWRP